MKVVDTPLPDVLVIEPKVFGDSRGFFLESYNQRAMAEIGIRENFVQDNHSFSAKNVLRGLHYQVQNPQGKLVRAIAGEILDVGGFAQALFQLWQMVQGSPFRREQSDDLGSLRIRSRLSCRV